MRALTAAILVFATLPTLVAGAAEREVIADEAPVRSAPFEVAPEIARVRAGDRLPADDQPQGVWRRVQLSDGRYGFLRDADVREPPPVPVAAPAPGAAPASPNVPAAADVAPVAAAGQPPVARLRAPAPVNAPPQAGPALLSMMFEICRSAPWCRLAAPAPAPG